MNRPELYTIPAFDATKATTIKFKFEGSYIIKSEAVFYNSETGSSVYGLNIFHNSTALEYILPANSLTNSTIPYYVKIRVYDELGNVSDFSDARLFYCVSTPTFKFNDLKTTDRNYLDTASHKFSIYYDDGEQDELIGTYSISLYDENKNLISTSPTMYDPNIFYEIFGLAPNTSYFIRALGETQNGMPLDTGFIALRVVYETPATYTLLTLKNRPETADILATSNIVSIDGKTNPDPAKYINSKSGKAIVLTDENSYVIFDNSFETKDKFDLEIAIVNFKNGKVFLEIDNGSHTLKFILCNRPLSSATNDLFVVMFCYDGNKMCRYTIQSNAIDYAGGYVRLSLKQENGLLTMYLQEV